MYISFIFPLLSFFLSSLHSFLPSFHYFVFSFLPSFLPFFLPSLHPSSFSLHPSSFSHPRPRQFVLPSGISVASPSLSSAVPLSLPLSLSSPCPSLSSQCCPFASRRLTSCYAKCSFIYMFVCLYVRTLIVHKLINVHARVHAYIYTQTELCIQKYTSR